MTDFILHFIKQLLMIVGYVSYREESEGTWFIKALCQIFMEEAHRYHVVSLLDKVKLLS